MKVAMNAGALAFFCKALLSTTLLALSAGAAMAQNKVVFQVSDADIAKWNLTMNNVRNVQQDLGADKV